MDNFYLEIEKIVKNFWFGLLILIFKIKKDILFLVVIGGLFIVVFCMLDNKKILEVIEFLGVLFVGLSVNMLGKLSLIIVDYVFYDL